MLFILDVSAPVSKFVCLFRHMDMFLLVALFAEKVHFLRVSLEDLMRLCNLSDL